MAYLGPFSFSLTQPSSKRFIYYFGRFKHIYNSGLFSHVMFQTYSAIFTTLDTLTHICPHSGIFLQIQAYSESWHSQTYSCILRHVRKSEPMTSSGIFRTVNIFSQFQARYSSGPATPGGSGGSWPPPPSCVAKRKKGNKGKKEFQSKHY